MGEAARTAPGGTSKRGQRCYLRKKVVASVIIQYDPET
jgi:hypothetical protein